MSGACDFGRCLPDVVCCVPSTGNGKGVGVLWDTPIDRFVYICGA